MKFLSLNVCVITLPPFTEVQLVHGIADIQVDDDGALSDCESDSSSVISMRE